MHICKTDKYSFDCSDNTRSPGWLLYPRWRDDAAIERRPRELSRQVFRVNENFILFGIAYFFLTRDHIFFFYLTHVRLHLLDRPIERIGYLPRRHDCEIDGQQYPDHHKQLVIFYHLNDTQLVQLSRIKNCDEFLDALPSYWAWRRWIWNGRATFSRTWSQRPTRNRPSAATLWPYKCMGKPPRSIIASLVRGR